MVDSLDWGHLFQVENILMICETEIIILRFASTTDWSGVGEKTKIFGLEFFHAENMFLYTLSHH